MPKLSVKYIEALQRRARAGEQVPEWHPDGAGLSLRVRKNGRMSYVLRKSGFPPVTLGPAEIGLAHARALAAEAMVQQARGVDPNAEKRAARAARTAEAAAPANSFAEVTDQFIERYCKPKLRSWKKVSDGLARDATPRWGKLPISEITRPMVAELIDSIVDRGSPRQAALVHAYLHKLFKWSIGRGYIAVNPASDMERPAANPPRERVLSDAELALIWRAAERAGWPFGRITQLLILSGQRKSEIADGRWSEIDLGAATWSLPSERVKNKRPHVFPLSPMALEILSGLPRLENANDYVFSKTGRTTVSGFGWAKWTLDAIVTELNGGEPIPPWSYHDLRRTAATKMGDLGIAPHVIEEILNHKSGAKASIAGVYNRSRYWPEMVGAVNAWSRRLNEIVTGADAPSNVVSITNVRA